jgi:hypothetical protein
MNGFQKVVLSAAIIILILALIFIGIALSNAKDSSTWPPIVAQCPDYWEMDGSGNNATCNNVMNLGTCKSAMNFNNAPFTGSNSACAKYNWATNCGVTWDGITYGVNNPCQTTS